MRATDRPMHGAGGRFCKSLDLNKKGKSGGDGVDKCRGHASTFVEDLPRPVNTNLPPVEAGIVLGAGPAVAGSGALDGQPCACLAKPSVF